MRPPSEAYWRLKVLEMKTAICPRVLFEKGQ